MLRSEEQGHEKDQESILTQSTAVNRISIVWESLLLGNKTVSCFWSRDTAGQCSATCDSATCRTSMPKKNFHSATCHRSVRSQLVKKLFRIFSEDKYSQSVTLQQCQCMHLLCSAVFSALFVCALKVL